MRSFTSNQKHKCRIRASERVNIYIWMANRRKDMCS